MPSLSVIVLISTLLLTCHSKSEERELLLVLEVARHGARSPGKIYPFALDPSQNFNDTSKLTSYGKQQH
jgi:hypothetical protein